MLGAAVALYFGHLPTLLALLFLLGVLATIFGPLKYSLMPQHLRQSELVGGNALVDSGTFLAILIGTITGGLLVPTSQAAAAAGGASHANVARRGHGGRGRRDLSVLALHSARRGHRPEPQGELQSRSPRPGM